jgi:hypothetical protein
MVALARGFLAQYASFNRFGSSPLTNLRAIPFFEHRQQAKAQLRSVIPSRVSLCQRRSVGEYVVDQWCRKIHVYAHSSRSRAPCIDARSQNPLSVPPVKKVIWFPHLSGCRLCSLHTFLTPPWAALSSPPFDSFCIVVRHILGGEVSTPE